MAGFWFKKPADWNLNRILISKCFVADCDPREGNRTCSYGERPFQKSRPIIFNIFQAIVEKILMQVSIWKVFESNPPLRIQDFFWSTYLFVKKNPNLERFEKFYYFSRILQQICNNLSLQLRRKFRLDKDMIEKCFHKWIIRTKKRCGKDQNKFKFWMKNTTKISSFQIRPCWEKLSLEL